MRSGTISLLNSLDKLTAHQWSNAMKMNALGVAAGISMLCTGCVAGPGGSNNAANRTVAGVGAGALIGALAGTAMGSHAINGAVVGAVAGGALGAAVNPNQLFRRDTRGYCYRVDARGQPIYDEQGQLIYDYSRRC
jgi:uncharacterized protein YcfJ